LSGCANDKNYYDPEYAVNRYNASWEKMMGAIDPNQTWNMASAKTLKVTAPESGIVSIYSKGWDESYVLAKAKVTSGTNTLKFDVPAGMTEVYAVLNTENGRVSQAVSVAGGEATVSFKAGKAVRTGETVTPLDRELVYAADVNLFPGEHKDPWNHDYVELLGLTHSHEFYKEWNEQVYATFTCKTTEEEKDPSKCANCGENYNIESSPYADVVEASRSMYQDTDNQIDVLYPYTQNYKIITMKAGEISLINIYKNTGGNAALIYYYVDKGATTDDLKKADKYVLIPNFDYLEEGYKKFRLTYYDPNNDYKPTYMFPEGKEIHFALMRGENAGPFTGKRWINYVDEQNIYAMGFNASLCMFSDVELNEEVYKQKSWDVLSSAALYSTHGVNILSFEDWGGKIVTNPDGTHSQSGGSSIDWNDVAFIVDADNVEELPSIDKVQSWTLAFEDLGATDDFDFNDVVLRITKNDTEQNGNVSSSINVDLCAAGGMLPTTVFFGTENLGEVHEKFGVGEEVMVNTGGVSKPVVSLMTGRVVEPGFTISDNARQFKIVVSDDDTKEITLPAATGVAPQAICIPGKWAWPTERTNISDAYTDFGAWGANYLANQNWYKTPAADKVVNK